MTANNKAKRKRTKKSGVFKRLEIKQEIRELRKHAYRVFEIDQTKNKWKIDFLCDGTPIIRCLS